MWQSSRDRNIARHPLPAPWLGLIITRPAGRWGAITSSLVSPELLVWTDFHNSKGPVKTGDGKSISFTSDLMTSQVRSSRQCLEFFVSRTMPWIWRSNGVNYLNSDCQAGFWRYGYLHLHGTLSKYVVTDVIANDVTDEVTNEVKSV